LNTCKMMSPQLLNENVFLIQKFTNPNKPKYFLTQPFLFRPFTLLGLHQSGKGFYFCLHYYCLCQKLIKNEINLFAFWVSPTNQNSAIQSFQITLNVHFQFGFGNIFCCFSLLSWSESKIFKRIFSEKK
jgi:hypothetical protein